MSSQVKNEQATDENNRESSQFGNTGGRNIRNVQGQTFGNLIAVCPTNYRVKKGGVIWACQCICKEITYVAVDNLLSGNTKSCGCLRDENRAPLTDSLHFVDGTCVEVIEKRKHRSDNKSGFRGVEKIRDDRFRVTIGFKGKNHHIGYFSSLENAIEARIKAEEKYYHPFIQDFYSSQKE